jgi:probable rRNA maturation factor
MRELNKHYLGEDRPTDVLAFSVEESISTSEVPFIQPPNGILHLGEIIICYPQALTQAREHSHSADREITLLLIHGILHLLGFDHNTPESEDQMKTREREMLKCLWKEES